ncbi:ABC transporter substrate-binding protein [Pelagibacterium montanilacus]|uniref:ABC transporter substrate-binding protein n=1 Tax=Pelagibacterium montanilacus TaxID=2185280 RepID=UPI000F8DDCE3|nr:ABC transporter substrate-binding protein [Pelagibacterium montanilacus]
MLTAPFHWYSRAWGTAPRHKTGATAALSGALMAFTCLTAPVVAQEATDAEVTDLTVWFAREYTVPSSEQLEAFAEETGITLTVDVQPSDNLFQQLIRMRDAGLQLPDVVHLDGFLRPVVVDAGVVVPIDDVVDAWEAEDPEGFAQIYDATWADGVWNDERYGMANTASMEEVFMRTDWLAEAGVEGTPETWDEVLEFARATKEAQPDAVALGWWAQRGNGANLLYSVMSAMGVEFDGSIPDLRSEGGQYFISFVQSLAGEELISPEAIAWNDDNMRGGFVASSIGMMLDSAPTSVGAQDAGLEPGENFTLVPMPTSRDGSGEQGTLVAPARTFFITSSAEERGAKDEAGLALRFLMDPDVALELMLLGADPHRTDAVLGDQEAVDQWLPIWDEDNISAFRDMGTFPVDTNFIAAQGVAERLNEFLVSNPDMDPMEVADQWQPEFDAIAQ